MAMYRFYTDYSYTILGMSAEYVNHIYSRPKLAWGYVGVTVQIMGSPVKFEPNDATYKIRIWHNKPSYLHENYKITPEDFEDEHLISEFSISPTEDPVDLERRYGDILRKYDVTTIEPVEQLFNAPYRRQAYIDRFEVIINNIVNTDAKERAPMENNHIRQRKKGHSHVPK
jgi:hypothetical protein